MKKLFFFLFSIIYITSPIATWAANYYVSTTGNDANPGTITQPWLTFENAVSSLIQPGDTIFVRGGVYSTYPPNLFSGKDAILPLSSFSGINGDANNPITYKSFPGETAIIDPQNSTRGIYIQTSAKTGIIIEGFEIRNSAGRGIDVEDGVHHLIIRNNHIYDSNGKAGDNIGGIVFNNNVNNVLVENNVLHGNYIRPAGSNLNGANIIIFDKTNKITIRNNELYDSEQGIFYKHSGNGPSLFENNYLHDLRNIGFWIATDNVTMRNNLIVRVHLAFKIHEEAGCVACSRNNIIDHNTAVDSYAYELTDGLNLPGAISTVIRNNIFYHPAVNIRSLIWHYGSDADFLANTPDLQASNNNYFTPLLSFSYFGAGDSFGNLGAIHTLSQFQALSFELASFNADPLFLDPAKGDYRLRTNSPALGQGTDGKNLGANVCLITIITCEPISAPQNLAIN